MTMQTIDTIALEGLSPENMGIIQALIRQMADGEGNGHRLERPIDGIPQWQAKLRQERYSPRTIEMYAYYAERYLEATPTPGRLDIQSHLAARLDGGTSPAAVENMRKALRSLFGFLCDEGLWHEDPTSRLRKVKVPYSSRPCPTPDEIRRVLDARCFRRGDTDKLRTLIRLLSTTGLRLSECVGLRKGDIDWQALELRITGKGDKFRIVPLLPSTADTLKGWLERHPSPSPYVFPGEGKSGHASIHNIEKTLRRACIRAGVRPFSPHGLRHFYATESLRKGAKLEVVGRILGHASIGITADIYRHVKTDEMHQEHMRFAPAWDGADGD